MVAVSDMGPAERALKARGVSLQPLVFDEPRQDRGQEGFICAEPLADGSALFIAMAREDLPVKAREDVAEWMLQMVNNFLSHGPGHDGWFRRKVDGTWQMWVRGPRLER